MGYIATFTTHNEFRKPRTSIFHGLHIYMETSIYKLYTVSEFSYLKFHWNNLPCLKYCKVFCQNVLHCLYPSWFFFISLRLILLCLYMLSLFMFLCLINGIFGKKIKRTKNKRLKVYVIFHVMYQFKQTKLNYILIIGFDS